MARIAKRQRSREPSHYHHGMIRKRGREERLPNFQKGECMNVEGVGIAIPIPEKIYVPDFKLVEFTAIASERNKNNRYGSSADPWKAGIKKNPIEEGLRGEFAYWLYLEQHGLKAKWNPDRISGGDGGVDILCNTISIQVKTGVMWIRRVNNHGCIVPLGAIIYAFATIHGPNQVLLDGWIFRDKMIKLGRRRTQGHFNIEVNKNNLQPLHRMITYLRCYE